jgi:hypothetical protein
MSVDFFIDFNVRQLQRNLDKFEHQQIPVATEEGMLEIRKETLRRLRRTVHTWSAPQPQFTADIRRQGSLIGMETQTDSTIYKFVDLGTRVRRAVMSPGFVSKTVPGSLKTRRGSGGVVFISKKINLPGIKARRFTETISKDMETDAPKIIDKHIERAIKLKQIIIGQGV